MKSMVFRSSLRYISVIVLILTAMCGLQSCSDWGPAPPPGYDDRFYDNALIGTWKLVSINDYPVSPAKTNYLRFNGNGRGSYSYYVNGRLMVEPITYWCQYAYDGGSRYEINISYSGEFPSDMNYWFSPSGEYLTLQWYSSYGLTTYVYVYTTRYYLPDKPE